MPASEVYSHAGESGQKGPRPLPQRLSLLEDQLAR
jgi:hypothetical protein